jgi:hypothetical protein
LHGGGEEANAATTIVFFYSAKGEGMKLPPVSPQQKRARRNGIFTATGARTAPRLTHIKERDEIAGWTASTSTLERF